MPSEIFRFMTIRPPQEVEDSESAKNALDLNGSKSDFLASLVRARKPAPGTVDPRLGIRNLVQEFLKSTPARFIDSRKKVDSRLLTFYDSLIKLEDNEFKKNARNAFSNIFNIEPKKFVQENDFNDLLARLAESIVIAAIDDSIESEVRSLLVRIAKTVGLIQKLAVLPENQDYSRNDFHNQIIVLPEDIFPLPGAQQDASGLLQPERDRLDRIQARQTKLLELSKELTANRNAISDLQMTFERSRVQADGTKAHSGFSLLDEDTNNLNPETKSILQKVGLGPGSVNVAFATSLIEKHSSRISSQLHSIGRSMNYVIKIGDNLLPSDTLVSVLPPGTSNLEAELGDPEPCPPAPNIPSTGDVTVPANDTYGEARVLGMADLMIVEQELLRYELGEIAHIENVLKSETPERTFRTLTTTEESTLTETEETEEKTKDLTTTERFELQTESEKVINENTSIATGLTVNASYGPSIDATSNFNYTHSSALQESNRASATFARETTTRATNKIQKRTLERRFLKTVHEVEEFNKHGFDNTAGSANISGVYRFVDKIYHAQIINYGKRLMLEFVVPEPAAFLRYAMTKQPAEGSTLIKPQEPGYCKDDVFTPLQPTHLDKDWYLYWGSKYLAEDITPPPATYQMVSSSKVSDEPGQKSNITSDVYGALDLEGIAIPAGYKPVTAAITIDGYNIAKDVDTTYPFHVTLQVQKQIFFDDNILDDNKVSINLEDAIADKVPVTVLTKNYEKITVVANIYCVLTEEKYQEWQIKTYNSIMNAYNEQKSAYDKAMEEARIRASYSQIGGTNPIMNRECEKTELKKGCISLLTAQNFETFDAMKRNVAPNGYPELAFADANAEGRYIQFFENAFEWVNMTYVFYPYFWGKKDDWVTISQIADSDPLYTHFLQAGAARVQVPVRQGFEKSLLHYLKGFGIWYGEGTLVNTEDGIADPLHISVLDELKEQLGNQNMEGKGRLNVKKGNNKATGVDTEFAEDDENKRIIIKGKTYVIKERVTATEIQLTEKYTGPDDNNVPYSMGPKLVGEPWEVKLPTNLVMIDNDFAGKIKDQIDVD